MILNLAAWLSNRKLVGPLVVTIILALSVILGSRPSLILVVLPIAGIGAIILLQQPVLGLMVIIVGALVARIQIGTGTEVILNPATLLVPATLVVWFLNMIHHRKIRFVSSRLNLPLLLFLLLGILSLLIGLATWDPAVPRSGSFIIVQLAQWAILAFSAAAFWMTGNLIHDLVWLQRLTFLFLALAGGLAIIRVVPGTYTFLYQVATYVTELAPFWMLLAALAGGQLLFNRHLTLGWQIFLLSILAAVGLYVFFVQRAVASNWVGVVAVMGVLAWLRWPRLRWLVILLLLALTVTGVLYSVVWEFAGGDQEWEVSGGSRLALISRVIEVTMRNPITGLGPAAYRPYAGLKPLLYRGAFWVAPRISSHNNFVDLFSHVGLLGIGIFFWFTAEIVFLGNRLRVHFKADFAAGYANAMLAAGVGALVLMMFADWILPFVYNIGFIGFQASVLVWLFLGGLLTLDQIESQEVTR